MPPVGIIPFVHRGLGADVTLHEIVYSVLPFVVSILANVVLVYFVAEIVSWLASQIEQ
ncbi:MAG: TRAP-type C4-dicarboxylate transport system permease large subunit [Gammaproteobacteria bacterium]|jgi:TRAP-type C4-dicarboxylate transport system permease large subunit